MTEQNLLPYLALAPYAAVALSLAITLALFLSLKYELQRSSKRERKRIDAMLERLQEAGSRENAADAPDRSVFVPVSAPPGFNLQRRVHIARLLRRGDDPAQVAAVLNIPVAEVELFARVQQLGAQKQMAAAAAE